MITNLIKKETVAVLEYPNIEGFKVKLRYLGKRELKEIYNDCISTIIDPKTRTSVERLNKEKFANIMAERVVLDWEGLTIKGLNKLVPVELTEITDMNEVISSSFDNKKELLENSSDFDGWVTETTRELSNFNDEAKTVETKNLK